MSLISQQNEARRKLAAQFGIFLPLLGDEDDPAPTGDPGAVTVPSPGSSAGTGVKPEIGEVRTLDPGAPASAAIAMHGQTWVLSLGIPRGAPGSPGRSASAPAFDADAVELEAGAQPTVDVVEVGDGTWRLQIGVPPGEVGDPGQPGKPGLPGEPGAAGVSPTLTIGNVQTGSSSSASLRATGEHAYALDLVLERGAAGTNGVGTRGDAGPANVLTMGTVTTGPAGSAASATITGTAPAQTLNLTIPRGDKGAAAVDRLGALQTSTLSITLVAAKWVPLLDASGAQVGRIPVY